MKIHIPENTRKGVVVSVETRACRSDGSVFSKGDRITNSNLFSRPVLYLRSSDEYSVHRVAALALLQSGGEAHFSRTMYDSFDRIVQTPLFFASVVLPPNTEVVL